jgi:hypothetical protein
MRRFLRDNGLSLTMFGFFLVFWAAQSVTGWHAANADNREHHQPTETYPSYLTSGHFVEATAENWESEFLQMSGYVFLTSFLLQRGSPESNEDPRQARDREDVPGRCGGVGWSWGCMSIRLRWCCLSSSWPASPCTHWVARPSSIRSSWPTGSSRCRCSAL